jgi:hypothetical protein
MSEFTAEECEALVRITDKLAPAIRKEQWPTRYGFSPEEVAALEKLRVAVSLERAHRLKPPEGI